MMMSKKDENQNRRTFIYRTSCFLAGSIAGGALFNACEKSMYGVYEVDIANCIGCTDCSTACYYNAIVLPSPTKYEIDTTLCVECGKCAYNCKYDAISISNTKYKFVPENCIGCGKCVRVCKLIEEDCIEFTPEPFQILDLIDGEDLGCDPELCKQQCFDACKFDAIIIGDKASITEIKCTKCGECVHVCPLDAIVPDNVRRDEKRCDNCGKCFDICEANEKADEEFGGDQSKYAIVKMEPESSFDPAIDQNVCVSCGDCYLVCEDENAVNRDLMFARVDQEKCTKCGKCETACDYDAIKEGSSHGG